MTFKDWLRNIAAALSDDEPGRPFQRYVLKDLIMSYNDAICLVASYRPDLFTEVRVVKLTAGYLQDVRGCCVNVLDVLYQTDEFGNVIKKVGSPRNKTTVAKANWKKKSCLTDALVEQCYVIGSASIDSNLNGRFTVDPPVPCHCDAYVAVKCVERPCALDETQINIEFDGDCKMNVAAWHYVLARALSGDNFEASLQSVSQAHYKMFFDILNIQQQAEDRIESGAQATQ